MRPSGNHVLLRPSPSWPMGMSGFKVSVTQAAGLPPLGVAPADGLGHAAVEACGGFAMGIQAGTIISSAAVSGGLSASRPVAVWASVAARVCPGRPWGTAGDNWAKTAAKPDSGDPSADSASPKTPSSPEGTGVLGCKTDKTSSFMCVTGRPVVRTTASASVNPLSKKHDRQDFAASVGGVESGGTGIA